MRPVAILLLAVAAIPAGASTRVSGQVPATGSSPRPAATTGDTSAEPGVKVAILNDALPGFDRECAGLLAEELRKCGCDVTELSAAQICDQSVLSPERFFLYVIPQCRIYPAAAMDALITFTNGRGHVLFLGGPFLDDPVWPTAAGWVNHDAIVSAKTGVEPQRGLWADKPLSTAGWSAHVQRRIESRILGSGGGRAARAALFSVLDQEPHRLGRLHVCRYSAALRRSP